MVPLMTLFIRDERYVIMAAKQVAVKRLLKDIVLVMEIPVDHF